MTIKVMVSGAGGDVAQGVIQALEKSSLDIEIYAICVSRYSSWLHKTKNTYLAPLVVSDDYIPFLIEFINTHHIDVFMPCIDSEIRIISENKSLIELSTNAIVMVDDIDKVRITDDKYLTYQFLKDNDFIVPETCIPKDGHTISTFINEVGFPIIAKKRNGRGSNHVDIINTNPEARNYIGQDGYVLQEYIHGDDYEITAGIYLSDEGEDIGICTLLRELKCGSTYRAKRIINSDINNYLVKVAKALGMKYLNIQARVSDNKVYIFEFNGRLSGTTGIISRIFNAPELFVRERVLHEKLAPQNNDEIFYVMRYWQEIVVGPHEMQALIDRSSVDDEIFSENWD